MEKQLEVPSQEIEWKDPEWSEDDLLLVLCWIDIVTAPPVLVTQELNQELLSGTGK